MSILFNVCASQEDLGDLKGMKVVNITNFRDSDKEEGVIVDFEGKQGERISISIMAGAEINRSIKKFPLYCAQNLRDYEGYTIKEVQSDEHDLNCRVILENEKGDMVTLFPENALDGETLFVSETISNEQHEEE